MKYLTIHSSFNVCQFSYSTVFAIKNVITELGSLQFTSNRHLPQVLRMVGPLGLEVVVVDEVVVEVVVVGVVVVGVVVVEVVVVEEVVVSSGGTASTRHMRALYLYSS